LSEGKLGDIRTATLSSVILGLYLSVPSEEYESLVDAIGEMSGTIIDTLLLETKAMKGYYRSVPEALTATMTALGNLLRTKTAKIRFLKGREAELVIVDCPICEASKTLSISPEKPICRILGLVVRKVTIGYLQRLGIDTDIAIEETECKAKGAPACVFRLTWTGEQIVHTKYVEWEEKRADEEVRARLEAITVRSDVRVI
jgi:predicted hydrocarbon binding protein